MKIKTILLSFLVASLASAFEINTHQAITSCALSANCKQKGAENLNYFAMTMKLNGIDYSDQVFEKYENQPHYFKYVVEGKGLGDYLDKDNKGKHMGFQPGTTYLKGATDKDGKVTNLIDYNKNSYISLIEAGFILEYAQYHRPIKQGGCA